MKHEDIDLMNEDNSCVASGFVGKAFIYDKEVYVNTYTGAGYKEVIDHMNDYIDWYSGKIRLSGFDREDIKQLIAVFILDGIRRYNPEYNIKLSTFLYVHVKNRMVSRIKEENRQSLNATYIEQTYKIICICGAQNANNKRTNDIICESCGAQINDKWTIRGEHCNPISLDGIATIDGDETTHNVKFNDMFSFFGNVDSIEDVERELDFDNIINKENETTKKIAELMYYNDYSITDAAEKVKLCCWAASLRLKKLKNNPDIRDFFLDK